MKTAVCTCDEDDTRARRLAELLDASFLPTEKHRFPDGESGVRVLAPVPADVIVLADLARPDEKFLPLAFLLDVLRELGARRITLVAPYLPYLRQDKRFREGEAVTSCTFAKLLSPFAERLVTIDPHLHRYRRLEDVYALQGDVLSAAPLAGDWIREHVPNGIIVGPDMESEQWVKQAAVRAGVEYVILEKKRRGDRDVSVRLPGGLGDTHQVPVLVDDIISSGHTMAETIGELRRRGFPPPVCIGVHAVFADGAEQLLEATGAGRVLTTNTIAHPRADIDILPLLAAALC